MMEIDVMAGTRVKRQLELGVPVHRPGGLVEDPRAVAVAEDVIVVAGEVEGGAGVVARVLRAREQRQELGHGEGLLGGLGEVDRRVVVVGAFEVVEDLGGAVRPCQVAAVAVAV